MSETQETGNKRIVIGSRRRTEESAFDKAAVLESPFPSERTLHWQPLEADPDEFANTAASSVIPVVITQEVLLAVNQHVAETLDHELGGFLLGNRYRCPNTGMEYVIIDQYSRAQFTEATAVSLSFTHEAWAHLADELSGKFLGKLIVGWYHSHPRLEVFLSSYDMELHKQRFPEPWMPALVIEPEKQLGGFFCWNDGRINPRLPVGFYEYLQGEAVDSKESVVLWKNHACINPLTNAKFSPTRSSRANALVAQRMNGDLAMKQAGPRPNATASKFMGGYNITQVRAGVAVAGLLLLISIVAGAFLLATRNTEKPDPGISVSTNPLASLKISDVSYKLFEEEKKLGVTMKILPSLDQVVAKINGKEAQVQRLAGDRVLALIPAEGELGKMMDGGYKIDVEISDGSNPGPQLAFYTDPKNKKPNVEIPVSIQKIKMVNPPAVSTAPVVATPPADVNNKQKKTLPVTSPVLPNTQPSPSEASGIPAGRPIDIKTPSEPPPPPASSEKTHEKTSAVSGGAASKSSGPTGSAMSPSKSVATPKGEQIQSDQTKGQGNSVPKEAQEKEAKKQGGTIGKFLKKIKNTITGGSKDDKNKKNQRENH